MQGPFDVGAPTQGYQSRLTRAEIFRQGIQKWRMKHKSVIRKALTI